MKTLDTRWALSLLTLTLACQTGTTVEPAPGDASAVTDGGAPDSGASATDSGTSPTDSGAAPDGGGTCSAPGAVTTPTPPTVSTATSDFNVTLLACTRTGVQLACELGVPHAYTEAVSGTDRTLTGNGIPDHDVGPFPNPGNPNTISAQAYTYKVPVTPSGSGAASRVFGIAFSGSVFDPGTAETWNNNADWRYEALRYGTAPDYFDSDSTFHPTGLGLDCNFAHVQPNGAYHYHGIPSGMMPAAPAVTQVGWAGDGAPIFARWGHASASDATSPVVELRSSWRLKAGTRPSGTAGPGGTYDGTFGNDWEYVAGSGDLDECNGRTGVVTVEGVEKSTYHYVLTNTFPYIPRCFHSAPDASFNAMEGPGGGGGGTLPTCTAGQTERCCGDRTCDGPETAMNCPADCR